MRFKAELLKTGANTTGIELTSEMLGALGGKRQRLRITLNGFSFSVTPGSMGGRTMIPVSAERRAAAKVAGGIVYEIEIVSDDAPVEIEVPDDFSNALAAAGLRPVFDRLAASRRKEHVRAINEAKTEDTRQRRIAKAIATISGA